MSARKNSQGEKSFSPSNRNSQTLSQFDEEIMKPVGKLLFLAYITKGPG